MDDQVLTLQGVYKALLYGCVLKLLAEAGHLLVVRVTAQDNLELQF